MLTFLRAIFQPPRRLEFLVVITLPDGREECHPVTAWDVRAVRNQARDIAAAHGGRLLYYAPKGDSNGQA